MAELLTTLVLGSLLVAWRLFGRAVSARAASRSATVLLEVSRTGVRRTLADGRTEEVGWDELQVVEVVRADRGPHGRSGGVLVLAAGEERGCLVPLDRLESSGVLTAIAALPGFRVENLVAAVSKRAPSCTRVWVRT
ncbi:MAG: hypothetical protein KatS3mg008_0227 [Acidimicrobiales bacterium]|nr:MAG: hypothetical protein KatS3mg008_0227 [Acidimicrobiales bacterium]